MEQLQYSTDFSKTTQRLWSFLTEKDAKTRQISGCDVDMSVE